MKRSEVEGYEVADSGRHFAVKVFSDFVIKTPRNERNKSNNALKRIAQNQQGLSGKIPGTPPCWKVGDCLYMEKAKGIRADHLTSEEYKQAHPQMRETVKKIKNAGYTFNDNNKGNWFYDKTTDKVTIVDYHQVKKGGGPK